METTTNEKSGTATRGARAITNLKIVGGALLLLLAPLLIAAIWFDTVIILKCMATDAILIVTIYLLIQATNHAMMEKK